MHVAARPVVALLALWAIYVLVAGIGGSTRTAHAGPATVAVVAIEMKGNVAPELRSQLQRSIQQGIKDAKQRAVSTKKLRRALRKTPELRNCTSTTCLQRIGELTKATRFVRASVDGSGASYTVALELLSSDPNNRVVAKNELKCAVCTITDLSAKISATTVSLFTGARRPVDIVILTRPEGAVLRINDKDAGASPYNGKLTPGSYQVTALLAGHKEAEKTIIVNGGKEEAERFEIILTKVKKKVVVTPPTKPVPEPKRPYKLLKYVTAGAGGVVVIAGLVLMGRDGENACTPDPPITQCMDLHNTGTVGLLTVGVGVAALGVSVWMWLQDKKHAAVKPSAETSGAVFAPTRGGAVLGWRGRF